MKNKIALIVLLLTISFSGIAQLKENDFIGTWTLSKNEHNIPFPVNITIDYFNDSLMVIPSQKDTLISFYRIIEVDSFGLNLERFILFPESKNYTTILYRLSVDDKTGSLKLGFERRSSGAQRIEWVEAEYSFQTECCSNHNPKDCADNPNELKKLKDKGCTGFHRPK
jgi:hypothetical protein